MLRKRFGFLRGDYGSDTIENTSQVKPGVQRQKVALGRDCNNVPQVTNHINSVAKKFGGFIREKQFFEGFDIRCVFFGGFSMFAQNRNTPCVDGNFQPQTRRLLHFASIFTSLCCQPVKQCHNGLFCDMIGYLGHIVAISSKNDFLSLGPEFDLRGFLDGT